MLHWSISFLGRGRSERTTTEQQIFAPVARWRGSKRGAADLVSDPGAYDAAREMLETTRRAELEAQALEEARLTDAGERGVPVAEQARLSAAGSLEPVGRLASAANASRAHFGRMKTPSASTVTPSASLSVARGQVLMPSTRSIRASQRRSPSGVPRR